MADRVTYDGIPAGGILTKKFEESIRAESIRRAKVENYLLGIALGAGCAAIEVTWPDDMGRRKVYLLPIGRARAKLIRRIRRHRG